MHVSSAGQSSIFGVLSNDPAAFGHVLHRQAKQPGVGHGRAVIGEHPHPRAPHLVEMRERFTRPSHRDGTGRHDRAESCLAAPVDDITSPVTRIDRRIGVGHRHDRRVSPRRGRP